MHGISLRTALNRYCNFSAANIAGQYELVQCSLAGRRALSRANVARVSPEICASSASPHSRRRAMPGWLIERVTGRLSATRIPQSCHATAAKHCRLFYCTLDQPSVLASALMMATPDCTRARTRRVWRNEDAWTARERGIRQQPRAGVGTWAATLP